MQKRGKASKIAEHPLLMTEWCFDENIKHGFDPWEISAHSKVKAFWKCSKCGHIYQSRCSNRQRGAGCNGECLGEKFRNVAKLRAQKTRETCIKKYGVVNVFQLDTVKEKSVQTCLKRYGTRNALQNPSIVEKREKTCLKKYGTKTPLQNKAVKGKQLETMLERYGVINPSQVKEFQEKKTKTFFKHFGKRHYFCKDEHLKGDRANYYRKYNGKFNKSLRDTIKKRDGYMCQYPDCGNREDLCVHHIDNVKSNNDPSNLVTVCRSCHSHITIFFPQNPQKFIDIFNQKKST